VREPSRPGGYGDYEGAARWCTAKGPSTLANVVPERSLLSEDETEADLRSASNYQTAIREARERRLAARRAFLEAVARKSSFLRPKIVIESTGRPQALRFARSHSLCRERGTRFFRRRRSRSPSADRRSGDEPGPPPAGLTYARCIRLRAMVRPPVGRP
jgi:hypothetical protein